MNIPLKTTTTGVDSLQLIKYWTVPIRGSECLGICCTLRGVTAESPFVPYCQIIKFAVIHCFEWTQDEQNSIIIIIFTSIVIQYCYNVG